MLTSNIRNKMERKVNEKLDSLEKYVPFINLLLDLDENKYKKFRDIRQWILSRKRYPMNVLQKIEQSIITQYRNLFFDDWKMPKHIMDIFNTYAHAKCYRVNLCSDDEDNSDTLLDDDSDDDVVIISTTPPPGSHETVQPLSDMSMKNFNSKDQEKEKVTVPRPTTEEPICIDSDDDFVDLCDTEEICDVNEEKICMRREDFKHEMEKKGKELASEAIERQEEEANKATSDNAAQGGKTDERKQSETNLENMDIDTLKGIYDELTKENGIDVEQLLKSLDVTSGNSEKINPNNVLHENNFSLQSSSISTPSISATDTNTAAQACLYSMQPVLPILPVPAAPLLFPLIPPQQVKLNLKDPRIVKLLEKNKTLQMISSGVTKAGGGSRGYPANHEPKTYGEYKRMRDKERKIREARRADVIKRAEAVKQREEVKILEEARRAQELQKRDEARKEEERKRTEEANRTQELKRIEAASRVEELNLEEEKKAEKLKTIEEVMRAEKLKKMEEVKMVEALNTIEKTTKTKDAETNKDLECYNSRNNSTLSNTHSETTPNSTENSTSTSLFEQHMGRENAENKEETRDLKRIILNTILPYGDKILDVLRREPALQGLNHAVAGPGTGEETGKKDEPISIIRNHVPRPNQKKNCDQNSSKAEKKRLKYKEPKNKTFYKRIRTISSSSASSSSSSSNLSNSRARTHLQSSNIPTTDLTKNNSGDNHLLTAKPIVKLRRLSPETILKYTNIRPEIVPKTINVHLVEDIKRTMKSVHRIVEAKPAKLNLKYKNINTLMTSENTTLCALCKSKPSDLTNHYRRVHKTESYVARLNRSSLNNLELNITFAKKVTKGASNIKKYSIKCAFCRDDIEDKFINFYKHFSIHTGEYAYQCGFCKLEKPYECDIQSHKCHTKSCRNAATRTLYQYPPNVLVIYIYCCKICNFVQLNEANTFKHLRDHHDKRQDDSSCIKKYILAAINDEESCEKTSELDTNFELLMKDDGILVRNEAIVEDMLDNAKVENETDADAETTLNSGQRQSEGNFISTVLELQRTTYASYLKQNMLATISEQKTDKCTVIQMKTACQDTKPFKEYTTSGKKVLRNSCKSSYRHYPTGFSYFGLYKCMANDCLYSTDSKCEILQHLNQHCNSECPPEGYLLCAYCQLDAEICNTPEMLIEHIHKEHKQSHFQCSICCYRGITPSHVLVHLKNVHPEKECELVYQCEIDYVLDTKMPEDLYKLLKANLTPLVCPLKDCFTSFLSRTWMKNHLMHAHSLPLNSDYVEALWKYACVYCIHNFLDIGDVEKHLILRHPDQQPYFCERNLLPEKEDDLVQNLTIKLVPLSTFPCEKIKQVKVKQEFAFIDDNLENRMAIDAAETLIADCITEAPKQTEIEVKLNVEQLMQIAEESVRHSLLKLIDGTGVTPNLLYHCPHTICGGFFSSYDLWYRHMTLRHCCIISVCPHCPSNKKEELPLVDFKEHFQKHRCHSYGCFHCGETFHSEQNCRDHVLLKHADLNPGGSEIHIEKVPLFFNHPFNVLQKKNENAAEDRYGFLLALQEVVQNRCKYVEKLKYESLKTQWRVPITALWLEMFPSFRNDETVKRKCLCQNCPFQTFDTDMFYTHLRTHHYISGSKFICSKCDFLVVCENWEPIIDHIKMHVLDIDICTVCSYCHHDRRKFIEHLNQKHRSRDVPMVTIIRSNECVQISIAVVFAQLRKTFSTTRCCMFCNESSTQWKTYVSHLKKVHHITLQYFCEECNEPLKLPECDEHFVKKHPISALRIRARIATNNQISVDTIMPLQLSLELNNVDLIAGEKQRIIDVYKTIVKHEPCDIDSGSDVEMLNEDDIVIANDTKQMETQNRNPLTMVNIQNLQRPNTNVNNIQMQNLPQPLPTNPDFFSHMLSQQMPPTKSNNQSNFTNPALHRLAIQSYNPNFTGDCNFRPVKIFIQPNIGISASRNDTFTNIQQ